MGSVALMMQQASAQAKGRAVVFTHVSVVNPDGTQDDVALAVQGNRIAAIGPTATVVPAYPGADIYDGRGKALISGLVNCHAHLSATLERGFNEDFGFPNALKLPVRPASLLSGEERTLMIMIGALEAIKTGTTSLVQFEGNIAPYAGPLTKSGLRMILMESIADNDSVAGALSPDGAAHLPAPVWSPKRRDEGMQRIHDLYSAWHGKNNGRVMVFPAASLAETSSPELLKAVRGFADAHELGYSIHLSQSHAEVDYMVKHLGLRPPAFLDKSEFLGPRLFAAHCRYMDDNDIALLGRTKTMISHQANMAACRGVIPPIPALRAAGSPIALGTDNNTNDLMSVMRTALLTERIKRDDPFPGTLPQPEDSLEDATLGGARALVKEKELGTLEVGKIADLIVVDTMRPYLVPAGRFISAWIHNGQPSDVESVMVDGEFIMRDRKVLTLDEAALLAEADKVGKRVWNKVKAAGPIPIPRVIRA